MRMKGHINGQEVIVMVDSGATNNFISTSTVDRLRLEPAAGEQYGVMLGNGYVPKITHGVTRVGNS